MANIKFTNFARTALAVGVGSGDVTMSVTGGTGALFPALTAGQYFYAVLENATLDREIVKVTARSTDTLTVTRGQDNTTARAWVAGDIVSLRLNAAAIEEAVVGTLLGANNLSDVANAATARSNIGAQVAGSYQAAGSYAASGANNDITSLTALTAGGLPNNSVLTADIADANVTPGKLSQPFTSGTAVATTSGTSVDITSIPSWVKRITICMNGVSTNGAGGADVMLRLGVGGVPETSGYRGAASRVNNTVIASAVLSTGVLTNGTGATSATTVQNATFVFNHIDSNTWSFTGQMAQEGTGTGQTAFVAGSKNLAGVLDMIRLTTSNGTDTFDAGFVNISYE